jgi:hypothetical protein
MSGFGFETHYFDAWDGDSARKARDPAFWRELVPELTVSDDAFRDMPPPFAFGAPDVDRSVARVRRDGYFETEPVVPRPECERIARAFERVVRAGFHPNFSLVYDEIWRVYARLAAILVPVFDSPYTLIADFWSWRVVPGTTPSGWAPHRDGRDRAVILRADGRPIALSIWIPFTDATPENGCVYVLPTSRDVSLPHHPEDTAITEARSVRALPALAGSVLGWNMHVLHWGGSCDVDARVPRVSVGIYFEAEPLLPPLFRVDLSGPLPFARRLAFVGATFRRYGSVFEFPTDLARFASQCHDAIA